MRSIDSTWRSPARYSKEHSHHLKISEWKPSCSVPGVAQVIANVHALDKDGDPVVLAINAASAALCVSNIPWEGPAGCVRVGEWTLFTL